MSEITQSGGGSRRLRLWELTHRYHCPVIGVCFRLGEIRELVLKTMTFPHRPGDYEIHCTATSECQTRTPLSSLLQKTLEKKYALAVSRARPLKTVDELGQRWREAIAGDDVPGTLWALLTHPASTDEFRLAVYADVHMLQHQLGASARREQQAWVRLQEENAMLGRELARVQQRFTETCGRNRDALADLQSQLDAARAEAVRHQALAVRHATERDSLRNQAMDAEENMRLLYRLQLVERENEALKARQAEIEAEYSTAQEAVRKLEGQLEKLLAVAEQPAREAELHLQGRTVLCVGGRLDAMRHFRSVVQLRGGAFMHHDGGREENIGRLESVISAADAVICQTGCISHNAYWRVKEQCKRSGKPCTFVGNPSLSSFLQVLDDLADGSQPLPREKEAGDA